MLRAMAWQLSPWVNWLSREIINFIPYADELVLVLGTMQPV